MRLSGQRGRRASAVGRLLGSAAVTALAALTLAVPLLVAAPAPTTGQLEREKLQQEIRQLELDNADHSGLRGLLSTYGGIAAGIAALGTVLVAVSSLVHQRNLDRRQRDIEATRRLDERFAGILTDLGDASVAVQAAAAVSLLTFLRPEHRDYHRQVRLVALANLKVRKPGPVTALLVRALADALRTDLPIQKDEVDFTVAELGGIDLTHLDLRLAVLRGARLKDADLSYANLQGVDAYEARLEGACFSGANLQEARFEGVEASKARFQLEANLNAAKFHDAVLVGARFESASLQSAHFDRARIEGARFRSANLNDAFLRPASFDEVTVESLTRSVNTWEAHYSPELLAALRQAVAARGAAKTRASPEAAGRADAKDPAATGPATELVSSGAAAGRASDSDAPGGDLPDGDLTGKEKRPAP